MDLTEWTKERGLQLERKNKDKSWGGEKCDGTHTGVYHLHLISQLFLLK
jgi:hypothetical protein